MKKIIFLLLSLSLVCLLPACSEEGIGDRDEELLGLGGEVYEPTAIDFWITDNYVKPYNMEVKYRWSRSELSLNNTLVPPMEANVVPVMEAIRAGWITPYEQVVAPSFIRKLSPKKFVLVGSPRYSGKTIVLGEAEGGRKIVIYRINWYKAGETDVLRSILKTCHHEFGHTLHQAVKYPQEFEEITPSGYTTSWASLSEAEAIKRGFISRYSRASATEDFAEMLAIICVNGRDWFEQRVKDAAASYANPATRITDYNPADALRSKESILVNYMKSVWDVNLYDQIQVAEGEQIPDADKGLVTRVQEAIAQIQADAEAQTSNQN